MKIFVTGGAVATSRGRPDAYLFDPFIETWTRLTDMARGRWYPTNVLLPDGQALVVSGTDEEGGNNNIPELFAAGEWTLLSDARLNLPLYPYLFVLPNGDLLYAGPGNPSRIFNVASHSWSSVGNSPIGGGSADDQRLARMTTAPNAAAHSGSSRNHPPIETVRMTKAQPLN